MKNENLSVRRAAEASDAPKFILHDRLVGMVGRQSGPEKYLTDEEEELAELLTGCASLRVCRLWTLFKRLLTARGTVSVSHMVGGSHIGADTLLLPCVFLHHCRIPGELASASTYWSPHLLRISCLISLHRFSTLMKLVCHLMHLCHVLLLLVE